MPGIFIHFILVIFLYYMLYESKIWAQLSLIGLAGLRVLTGSIFTLIDNPINLSNPALGVALLMGFQIFLLSRIKIQKEEV